MSLTPRSAKAKGRRFEMEIAVVIREAFGLPERDVQPTPMGVTGTDIKLSALAHSVFPYAVEAKNVEALNVWQAWKQTLDNTIEGIEQPVLITRKNKTEPVAVIRLGHFLDLVRRANGQLRQEDSGNT
jgi:hypothetical protein